jgi:hypothetical protein
MAELTLETNPTFVVRDFRSPLSWCIAVDCALRCAADECLLAALKLRGNRIDARIVTEETKDTGALHADATTSRRSVGRIRCRQLREGGSRRSVGCRRRTVGHRRVRGVSVPTPDCGALVVAAGSSIRGPVNHPNIKDVIDEIACAIPMTDAVPAPLQDFLSHDDSDSLISFGRSANVKKFAKAWQAMSEGPKKGLAKWAWGQSDGFMRRMMQFYPQDDEGVRAHCARQMMGPGLVIWSEVNAKCKPADRPRLPATGRSQAPSPAARPRFVRDGPSRAPSSERRRSHRPSENGRVISRLDGTVRAPPDRHLTDPGRFGHAAGR